MIADNSRRSKRLPGRVENIETEENGGATGNRGGDEEEVDGIRVPEKEEGGGGDGRREGG